jgi:hypothetical protein
MNQVEIGKCIKTTERQVFFQDEQCLAICGDMGGQICTKGCMNSYAPIPGMTLMKNSEIDGVILDAVVVNDSQSLTTLLYIHPKSDEELKKERAKLCSFGLTKSELNLFQLVMMGKRNAQIQKDLFISKATLKTHLNNIYKKLPESYQQYKKRR